ncbi:MAG: DUF433 domain-containing protein [Bryobacteraceae bacterium]|jgi:hypothetical protein
MRSLIGKVDTGTQWLPGAQMPAVHDSLLERITIDSDVRFGKPCIRGYRITVQEIPEWLVVTTPEKGWPA